MADFSLTPYLSSIENAGYVAGSTNGTAVTAAGSADTKGSWAELISSTSESAVMIVVHIMHGTPSGSGNDFLIDIGVGAAASEEIIVSNLIGSRPTTITGSAESKQYAFPINISKGSRIAARIQCSNASFVANVTVGLMAGSFSSASPAANVVAFGDNTGDSGGTLIVPAQNSKGSWAELVASSDEIKGFSLGFGTAGNTNMTTLRNAYDIAVGSAGNEEIILHDYIIRATDQEIIAPSSSNYYGISVAEGERISARASSSSSNTDRNLDLVLYGVK